MNPNVNMAAGALLATVFVLMSVSIASEGIFHSEVPEKAGFAIVAAEEPAAGEAGGTRCAAVPIAQLLAKADAKAGEAAFKKCQSCHSGEKGGPNKVGPDLWSIVDRPIAGHEGFSYSAGMKEFSKGGAEHWTFDNLNHFLDRSEGFREGHGDGFRRSQERCRTRQPDCLPA
jgi:cytochrome c